MDQTLTQTLTILGVPTQYIAIAGAVFALVVHVMPVLPKPGPTGVYATIYGILARAAGNYGNTANIPAGATVIVGQQPPPGSRRLPDC